MDKPLHPVLSWMLKVMPNLQTILYQLYNNTLRGFLKPILKWLLYLQNHQITPYNNLFHLLLIPLQDMLVLLLGGRDHVHQMIVLDK